MWTYFELTSHDKILPKNARVLVAPLNWGIGHATRCILIINQLQENGFTPIIASDGKALELLQKVFPDMMSYELPGYQVEYAKNSSLFNLKLLSQIPKFIKTYRQEHKRINELVKSNRIDAIISDNRFGVFHKEIPSVYLTHQLRVKSGWSTFFTSKAHQEIINKFDVCWVPDRKESPNLSGDLSHRVSIRTPTSYIGILSQFERQKSKKKYNILVLLSGPEPQRSIVEKKLLREFKNTTKNVCFVRGILESERQQTQEGTVTIFNYLIGNELQMVLNESELVIARSGFSTIMDLAKLGKKAFFIPTPGQKEQEYLALHLEKQKIAPYCPQDAFTLANLDSCELYTGFE